MSKVVKFASDDFYRRRAQEILGDAIVAFGNHKHEYAIDELEVAKRLDPKNAEIYFYSGIIKSILEDDGALEEHRKAVELEPENNSYRIWYGVSLFTNEDIKKAREIFAGVLKEEPDNEKAKIYYFRTLLRLEEYDKLIIKLKQQSFDSLSFEEREILGIAYFGVGEYKKSIHILESGVPLEELRMRGYHYICESYIKLGNYDGALTFLDKIGGRVSSSFISKYREGIEFLKDLEES